MDLTDRSRIDYRQNKLQVIKTKIYISDTSMRKRLTIILLQLANYRFSSLFGLSIEISYNILMVNCSIPVRRESLPHEQRRKEYNITQNYQHHQAFHMNNLYKAYNIQF